MSNLKDVNEDILYSLPVTPGKTIDFSLISCTKGEKGILRSHSTKSLKNNTSPNRSVWHSPRRGSSLINEKSVKASVTNKDSSKSSANRSSAKKAVRSSRRTTTRDINKSKDSVSRLKDKKSPTKTASKVNKVGRMFTRYC